MKKPKKIDNFLYRHYKRTGHSPTKASVQPVENIIYDSKCNIIKRHETELNWVKLFQAPFPLVNNNIIWAAPSEFGTYRLCEQRRFRRACAFAQSLQNLRCSLIQAVNQEEPSDRQPDPWACAVRMS